MDAIISELEELESNILRNDRDAIKRLIHLILPTGNLQEISLSSGWGEEFLEIAESLEKALH